MLGCYQGGDEKITTDFSHSNFGINAEHVCVPKHQQVALLNGDIVVFRDNEIFHARHNHGSANEMRRLSVHDVQSFFVARKPENWIQRVEARGQSLLQGI